MKNGVYGTSIAHDSVFQLFGVVQFMNNMSRVTLKSVFVVSDNASSTQIGLYSRRRYLET